VGFFNDTLSYFNTGWTAEYTYASFPANSALFDTALEPMSSFNDNDTPNIMFQLIWST
jgi:hypothetical protein